MAREPSDREDLLREATALVERVELQLEGYQQPVVVGFRRDSSASLFFGPDLVFQFNSRSQLRRAYRGGMLFKAEKGKLVSLQRQRHERQVQLVRHDLNPAESDELVELAKHHLRRLRQGLRQDTFKLVGQVPAEADVLGRIRRWLDQLPDHLPLAHSPHAR